MVVDFTIADQVQLAAVFGLGHERLPAAADVHDREPPVPEPVAPDLDLSLFVGTPVDHTV